uniref:Uncharacterized protein n=1 Tax=Moumouvirus sp. 'Monve' TaxID=1128131 RepID=H2EFY6_9VIRU|nr:hypothetical protein mv_R836 [Moumouvirus Monve]
MTFYKKFRKNIFSNLTNYINNNNEMMSWINQIKYK